MKILVLGLGNPLVSDDSVGLRVAAELKSRLADRPEIDVGEDYWGGLRLMERLVGYERAVVIDAIRTGAPPGTIHFLRPDALPTQRSASAHDVNLPTALALGRHAGLRLPEGRRHPPRRRGGGGCVDLWRVVHPGGGGGDSSGGRCGGGGRGPFSSSARRNGIISMTALRPRSVWETRAERRQPMP